MDPRLFDAVVLGNVAQLQRILGELPEADQKARIRLVRELTSEGDGVLHLAARYGHHDLVAYVHRLADLGPAVIDVAARNSNGDTAFHCAATPQIVDDLARMAGTGLPGVQPWHLREVLRARNHGGATCLHEAVRHGRQYVVEIADDEGVSPLYLATTLRQQNIVEAILRMVPAPSYAGPHGRNALHAAVVANTIGICELLLRPLNGDNSTARYLIRGADDSGSTPLHYLASSRSQWAIARHILRRGRDANARAAYCADKNGSLPIHVAAGHGRRDIITLLLQFCPDCVCSRNLSGQTYLHVAVQRERTDVVAYVTDEDDTLIQAISRAMARLTRRLLGQNPGPFVHSTRMLRAILDARNQDGNADPRLAAQNQEAFCGSLLTTILNARDQDGNTALHLAVLKGNQQSFRHLLRRREVDLNITNRERNTPLDLVFMSGEVDLEITQLEGHFIPAFAFLRGQRTFRYMQAGGFRGVHRWDDFTARFPSEQERAEPTQQQQQQQKKKKKEAEDKDREKVGKSASVLSVCATLILNATLALPFNVTKRFPDNKVPMTTSSFRVFLALDGVAFISSAVATFCCTYAGFATADNVSRLSHLYFGAICLVAASLAIVAAFALGLHAAFHTGLVILPTVVALLLSMVFLSGIIVPLWTAILHYRALRARLGNQLPLRLCYNRRLVCRFCKRHRYYLLAAALLVSYCSIVADRMKRPLAPPYI
ncbi:hypothetical protein ACP4OV_011898 [Aristida adscensionis]